MAAEPPVKMQATQDAKTGYWTVKFSGVSTDTVDRLIAAWRGKPAGPAGRLVGFQAAVKPSDQ
jgi:hypothetical protein